MESEGTSLPKEERPYKHFRTKVMKRTTNDICSEHKTIVIMGGRNSVNPRSRSNSDVAENDTEVESQFGGTSVFSGSAVSIQEASPYGEIFKRIREFEKLKDVSTFVTFLSAMRNESLCIYDIYEVSQREKLYEGRKPNRRRPYLLSYCWNFVPNYLISRMYKEDVILLDCSNLNGGVVQSSSEDFNTEILRLRSIVRFTDGTTLHGTDVVGRYGTIGYIFPSTPKDYTHEIRDEVHNMIFRVERKVLAFKPAEYEVCKVNRIEVTYWVATLKTPKQGTVVVQMLSSGLPLTHKALIMAFSLYLVTFGS